MILIDHKCRHGAALDDLGKCLAAGHKFLAVYQRVGVFPSGGVDNKGVEILEQGFDITSEFWIFLQFSEKLLLFVSDVQAVQERPCLKKIDELDTDGLGVLDFLSHGDVPSQFDDQVQAIESLVEGVESGVAFQTLLGVTGSGKTFTMAKVVETTNRPTLVLCHNKTLAAQLFQEFRGFFPDNAVEYFVSYYDYYQPEAYVPNTDTYIEKETSINEEIDRLRLSATRSLFERRDVLIVASVS